MLVSEFDYNLPEELIAQEPGEQRDQSRLLVVHRASSFLEHRLFCHLVDYVQPGDVLVLNETRVIPARLMGYRYDTGSPVEVFLLHPSKQPLVWEALVKPGRKAKTGSRLVFGSNQLQLKGTVLRVTENGSRVIEFELPGSSEVDLPREFEDILEILGQTPLPPYINRAPRKEDRERYQTVYAREKGSVAAPTAGLHFTPALLRQLGEKGVSLVPLVLHVGLGTFRPVKVERVEQHQMHSEYYRISSQAAETINRSRAEGGRAIAVGTTAARVLETVADEQGKIWPGEGWTDIFIYPGYRFKAVDGLITNFHLPRSTLLMLVSALAGRDLILHAYQEAVAQKYRFFSYGDAMFII
ncbi:MAG: tRNA preQ1(34) S-adenosylmethionine ribosyltransferase-isomerase QueA [Bacillota bacterium]